MKLRSKIFAGINAIGLACVVASAAHGLDREKRFDELQIGDRRSAVVALMGEPTSQVEAFTLGVPHARIQWVIGSRTYVAQFLAEYLISKRICVSTPNC